MFQASLLGQPEPGQRPVPAERRLHESHDLQDLEHQLLSDGVWLHLNLHLRLGLPRQLALGFLGDPEVYAGVSDTSQ